MLDISLNLWRNITGIVLIVNYIAKSPLGVFLRLAKMILPKEEEANELYYPFASVVLGN